MTSQKHKEPGASKPQAAGAHWTGIYAQLHRSSPPADLMRIYIDDMPLGMFDQEDLYPHLITEFRGERVAVPLGICGEGFNQDYLVADFQFQPLPQPEIHWGWSFPIHQVKLSGALRRNDASYEGMIRTVDGGNMELSCVSPRGLLEWLALPGCTVQKPAGRVFSKWEIFVEHEGGPRTMVRYDGGSFGHWP